MEGATLIRRFSVACLAVLAAVGALMAWVVSTALERNVLARAKDLTARIVRDEVTKEFSPDDLTSPKLGEEHARFAKKVGHLTLGPDVRRVKIWNRDREVVWADDARLVGQRFPDNDDLEKALKEREPGARRGTRTLSAVSQSNIYTVKSAASPLDGAALDDQDPAWRGGFATAVAKLRPLLDRIDEANAQGNRDLVARLVAEAKRVIGEEDSDG